MGVADGERGGGGPDCSLQLVGSGDLLKSEVGNQNAERETLASPVPHRFAPLQEPFASVPTSHLRLPISR